jgi:hypothetical protein
MRQQRCLELSRFGEGFLLVCEIQPLLPVGYGQSDWFESFPAKVDLATPIWQRVNSGESGSYGLH